MAFVCWFVCFRVFCLVGVLLLFLLLLLFSFLSALNFIQNLHRIKENCVCILGDRALLSYARFLELLRVNVCRKDWFLAMVVVKINSAFRPHPWVAAADTSTAATRTPASTQPVSEMWPRGIVGIVDTFLLSQIWIRDNFCDFLSPRLPTGLRTGVKENKVTESVIWASRCVILPDSDWGSCCFLSLATGKWKYFPWNQAAKRYQQLSEDKMKNT